MQTPLKAIALTLATLISTLPLTLQAAESPFIVTVRTGPIEAATPDSEGVTVELDMPPGHYVYADMWSIAVSGAAVAPESVPEPVEVEDPFLEEIVLAYNQPVTFIYRITDNRTPSRVTVELQGCTPELCLMPETRRFPFDGADPDADEAPPVEPADDTLVILEGFTLTGRDAGFKSPDELIDFIDRTEAGEGLAENPLQRLLRRHGMLLALVFILIGGLALNLTPCVLPMIPINLAIIGAGAQAGSKHRGLLLGLCYGTGMAVTYGALGLVVVLTGSQFGMLNASPWFNGIVAVVFILLALAMFDVFTIDLSRFQKVTQPGAKAHGPALTALTFGAVAALLAGACVAPVLIWVLVLATDIYQRGNAAGLILPFVLGIGMALPWPLAGAGISVLPKPGRWMNHVKVVFGVVILGAGLYFGYEAWRLWRGGAASPRSVAADQIDWIHTLDEGFARARAEGKPVFVDLWATWCTACLRMDRTTLRDPAVRDRLEGYIPVKFQTENLRAPDVAPFLDAWGVMGLPTYVILTPDAAP